MAHRKKRKSNIKRKLKFTLILIIVFVFVLYKYNQKNNIIDIDVFTLSKSYLGSINGIEIEDKYKKVIVEYLDLYTDSLVNLKSRDVTKLFKDSKGVEAYLTQSTIDTLVFHHSLQINDLKLKDAYYDIDYKKIKKNGNKITIDFIENDYYKFKYLDDITSSVFGIENTIVLNDDNGNITIDSLRVTRDNYVIYTSVLDENFTKVDIDNLKNKYEKSIKEESIKNKELFEYASNNKYVPIKKCDNSYNRQNAISYSYKYIEDRNDYYLDYSNLGGNCANFASQSIHEGGVPMDIQGEYEWKYYSDYLNEDNTKNGRSRSWVSTYYFYEYAKNNIGFGLCAEVDVNLFYADVGDIIHVGYKDDTKYSHTTLVSKVIKKDNKVIDILVNSNTTNLKDYPVLAYVYFNKRLIKILGYND